jgi:two-component system cell cycle sensor histidine kinase/response regulator CckA
MKFRYSRSLLAFLAVLLFFLLIGATAIVSYERKIMHNTVLEHSWEEMEMMVAASTESLLRHDYTNSKLTFERWANTHDEIIALKAVAANGFILVDINKGNNSDSTFEISKVMEHQGKEILFLTLRGDYAPVDRLLMGLNFRLVLGAVLLSVVMGIVLWWTQRWVSFKPLQHVVDMRTVELKEANALLLDEVEVRRGAEERTNELYFTLNTVVEHLPEGIALLDKENRVVLSNPVGLDSLSRLAGIKMGDVLTGFSEVPLEKFIVSPPHIHWQQVISEDAQGNASIFEVAARMISHDTGITGMVLAIKDVTAERDLQQRIQSQEKLAAIGHLSAGIAHDFNNILTCVIGFSEMLLLNETLDQESRKQIEAIHLSGQRASELIAQLMDFSRRSSNELESLEMNFLIRDFIEFINRIIPENINISFKALGEPVYIEGDKTKMQQVLANLAVNARDAMPGGGDLEFSLARVNVSAKAMPLLGMNSGPWVRLVVKDSGEGIPKTVLSHVFEPFYTTKGQGKGTGLGLAQVYGIVQQHGGQIEVESSEGTGTLFILYFPETAHHNGGSDDAVVGTLPHGNGQTVLVVEDDPTVREFLRKMLEQLDYVVIMAEDGEAGEAAFRENQEAIALVLTDIMMPKMDGFELGQILRALVPTVKIVAISGYSQYEDSHEGLFDVWLKKPFRTNEVAQAVRDALNGGG